MLIGHRGGSFFLILLVKRVNYCSQLVLRLPNSLCYQVVVAKKFSVALASHFEIVDKEYIKELNE